MKKSFMLWTLALTILFGCGAATTTFAQSKALKKDVKARVKQMEKEGFKVLASSQTLNYALTKLRTYLEEDPDNRIELIGIAIGKNVKIGRESAINNGITSYASRAKSQVVGKLKSLMAAADGEEIDKFGAAYEAGVNTKLGGLVKIHFIAVKENKDGSKEFNAFMTLDEAAARKAREEAAKEAKEKATFQNLSEQVEEFIGEPVEEM
jgi:hypothetical protein